MGRLKGIHWRDLECAVLQKGFVFARQKGDHRSYVKPGAKRPVVIPTKDDLPEFVIRTCLETAGISKAEFLTILGR